MRNKTFLILALTLLLACVFAFCVSAEEESTAPVIPEWSEVQIIDSISPKEGFDTNARVMLKNSDNSYTVYPAYYILKCTDTTFGSGTNEFDFSALNNAIADTTGEKYSYGSVVRLEIPSGFVTIQDRIFRPDKGVTSIMTLKVPEGVTSFGEHNFYQSTTLQELELPDSLTSITGNLLKEVTTVRKVTIRGAKTIGSYAFQGCTSLETVELGTSLETIGEYAFADCAKIVSLAIGDKVKTIGQRAFRNTTLLTGIEIPDTVTSIGTYAFYQSGITQVTIPKNAVLGDRAFESCKSLTTVYYNGTTVGTRAFEKCTALTTVVLGEGVTTIGAYSFNGCSKLENINIHDGITAIKERAFLECNAIKTVSVPKRLTELGTSAFYNCKGITGTIVIPETLTTVGNNAFFGCSSIQKVIFKGNIIGASMFQNCSKLSVLVLHKDITSIGTDALSGVVNGTFLTIYTGNDPERLKTLNGISRFNTKYIYSYEQYLSDIENGVTYNQNTIIYGADYCIELNGGEHTMNDTPTCVLPSGCIKCDRMPGEPALGHIEGALVSIVYIAFDQKGDKTYTCTRCEDEVLEENGAKPIFTAEGYACSPNMTSLTGGFTVDWNAYNDYISVGNGALRFGLIAVNSQKFAEGDELLTDGILSTTYGFQVEMTSTKYSVFSCSIDNFSDEARTNLNLIITLYIIDSEGNIAYVQSDSDYVNSTTIGTKAFDTVTLSLVAANTLPKSTAAPVNKEDE